jgi:hypothetical protein
LLKDIGQKNISTKIQKKPYYKQQGFFVIIIIFIISFC